MTHINKYYWDTGRTGRTGRISSIQFMRRSIGMVHDGVASVFKTWVLGGIFWFICFIMYREPAFFFFKKMLEISSKK